MTTFLFIAGHGPNRDGSLDPGASGFITKGEHRYFKEDFFPAMKKYLPKNSNVVLFDEYNVYDRSNLSSLAKSYGPDTVVIECHYDATGSNEASGGHVIVHKDYAPDKYDLAIRDIIKKHIGVRYNHRGEIGISGRSDLRNCNIARNSGVNYRLIELGFGTNKRDADIMVKNIDDIAKDFVLSLNGKIDIPTPAKPEVKPKPSSKKSIDEVVKEIINGTGNWGNGETRKTRLTNAGYNYSEIQSKVNEHFAPKAPPKPAKTIDQLAKEVIDGKHGNGDARKKALGSQYPAVQKRVDEILSKPKLKSTDVIAREVIAGKWGNGSERKAKLQSAGYDYLTIQNKINQILL